MSSTIRWLAIVLVIAAGGPAAGDPGFQVVVHADNPTSSLSRAALAEIFLKKKEHRWSGGTLAVPMDLTPDQVAREAFSRAIFDKEVAAIESYWQRMIFSGKAVPPPQAATLEEVFEHVLRNPGGIGYIPAGTVLPDWVKVLEITEDED